MRKPVCLAVLGISIVVAAVSVGVTLTRYLGLRAYSPKGPAQATVPPGVSEVPATPAEEWTNLFAPGDGMKMASRLPAVNAKGGSEAPRSAFLLVGTIVSSTPSARRAILWANGMKEPKAFREKEEVEPGAILASVERDKAWITRGKELEKLEILPVGSRARPTAKTTATSASTVAAPVASGTTPPAAARPSLPESAATAVPSPGKAQVGTTPKDSSGDDDGESLSRRERRKRAQGLRR
jgi:hypothetical protein